MEDQRIEAMKNLNIFTLPIDDVDSEYRMQRYDYKSIDTDKGYEIIPISEGKIYSTKDDGRDVSQQDLYFDWQCYIHLRYFSRSR